MSAESGAIAIVCSSMSAASCLVLLLSSYFSLAATHDPPVSPRFAFTVALPAAVLSAAEAIAAATRGAPVVGAVLARVLAPLTVAVVCTRRWLPWRAAAPDVRVAAAKEAAVLSRALAGTGVVFSTATVQGVHTVAFFNGDAAPPAGVPLSEHDALVPPLVLLPGYGNGSIFWMNNAAELTKGYPGRIFALDWLGTGCSNRPDWHARTPREAEAFFLDALDAWREAMGARQVVLVGHSLGGALSVAAWLRAPQGIAAVIGLSPAGLGGGVFDESEGDVPSNAHVLQGGRAFSNQPKLRACIEFLWERCAVTPGAILRLCGPFARRFTRAAVRRRAARWALPTTWSEETMDDIGDYFFHTQCLKGSGEYALSVWFGAGAKPRDPLTARVLAVVSAEHGSGSDDSSVTTSSLSSSPLGSSLKRIPICFAYGDRDWMRRSGAIKATAALRQAGFFSTVETIRNSGHHLYLENPADVNAFILGVCKKLIK